MSRMHRHPDPEGLDRMLKDENDRHWYHVWGLISLLSMVLHVPTLLNLASLLFRKAPLWYSDVWHTPFVMSLRIISGIVTGISIAFFYEYRRRTRRPRNW
jgi:hypothetical protein